MEDRNKINLTYNRSQRMSDIDRPHLPFHVNNQYHTNQHFQSQQVQHNPIITHNLNESHQMQCNISGQATSAVLQQPVQCHLQSSMSTISACSQHQPIYNQIYQSLQSSCYPSPYQPALFKTTELTSKASIDLNQQHLSINNTFRHQQPYQQFHDIERRLPFGNSNFDFQLLSQKSNPMLSACPQSTKIEKPTSILAQFAVDNSLPSIRNIVNTWQRQTSESVREMNPPTTTTNLRRKLVDSSSSGGSIITTTAGSESTSKSPSSGSSPVDLMTEGKLKSYLTHLVLASNIPFAYAIILIAFLITVIAATSIITILTIVLTITGYTAYPVTENTFHTSLIIGIVCAAFALVIVTAALLIWRRHCQAAYYYLDDPQTASRGTNSPQLSETYDDTEYGSIPVGEWDKHVKKLHVDGDIGFTREFEQIQSSQNPNLTYEHSQMAENKHKNRYINIVAYDHTRVTLRQLPGQKKPGSDYINANFIDGYNKPRAFIGTQGPLVSTFEDYWRMVWEQKVVIIVMITNLQERGRVSTN